MKIEARFHKKSVEFFGEALKIKKTKLRKTKNLWGFDFNKIKTCARSQFAPLNQKGAVTKGSK
ncbi:hypothetical protein ACSR7A_03535 [Pediococcus acidilactici]|uniref:hypothetical protein n=1 Tax=Pediococcus acidilactici TaxID=1254 RepID=UPI00071AF492|nr:hypothetical protein [Pediococcus acidilactici]